MSSGVEAEIALDAAVVLSLGLNRLLGGAAGLAAYGADTLAALAEGRAEARAEALRRVERHEAAIRAVLDRQAHIAALAESAERAKQRFGASLEVKLPAPLSPGHASVDDLLAWCAEADAALSKVEERISQSIANALSGQILAQSPHRLETHIAPESDADRSALPAEEEPAVTLARVLSRLLPEASEADQRYVTEAAREVAAAATPTEAQSRLTEVRLRIQAVNRRVVDKRAAVAAATRYQRELTGLEEAHPVRVALTDVMAGRRRLDEELRAEAERLIADMQAAAERAYLRDTLASAFTELGYEVDAAFETLTAHDGDVYLTKEGWNEHAVKMKIEDASGIRAALLRTSAAGSEEERRLDVERERDWCAAFEAAREKLAEAGIRADVRWRIEPGVQSLPLDPQAETRRQGRPAARPKERGRERGQ